MRPLEKLCKELGVEVGEPWLGDTGKRYVINEYGQVRVWSDEYDEWIEPYYNLGHIINGELQPVWEPNEGDIVYYPNITCMSKDKVDIDTYEPNSRDAKWWNYMIDNNLVFKTKEEAIEMANKMLQLTKEEI